MELAKLYIRFRRMLAILNMYLVEFVYISLNDSGSLDVCLEIDFQPDLLHVYVNANFILIKYKLHCII